MRDRQARGKDPHKDSESDYDDGPERRVRLGRGCVRVFRRARESERERKAGEIANGRRVKTEPFEDKERRGFALSVLDSPESLMMYALSAGDVGPPLSR